MFRTATLALLVLTSPAAAEFVDVPYSRQAIAWSSEMDRIAGHLNLDENETAVAKAVAAQWMHIGPCRGKSDAASFDSAAIVIGGSSSAFVTAILAMISVLSRENMGRDPLPEAVCRFAAEMR